MRARAATRTLTVQAADGPYVRSLVDLKAAVQFLSARDADGRRQALSRADLQVVLETIWSLRRALPTTGLLRR